MSEFKREKRYQVTKLSDPNWKGSCVVVEDDWPEYEIVWKMIQNRVEGKPNIIEQLFAANQRNKELQSENETCRNLMRIKQEQNDAFRQRIQELLDLVEVVERRNKQLEERIRVADAEELVAWGVFGYFDSKWCLQFPVYSDKISASKSLIYTIFADGNNGDWKVEPLYLHAQIPAEVELKAKIAELEAIIKASQEQEPVIWDGTRLIDYVHKLRIEACAAWSDVRDIKGEISTSKCQYASAVEERLKCAIDELYAKPVIKEQP